VNALLAPTVTSRTAGPSAAPRRIAYVLSLFPCYDETFILREIKALAARGVDLRILSLRRRADPFVQEDARPFLARTVYEPYLSAATARAVLRTLAERPADVLSLVGWIVKGCWRRPSALAKSLAMLPKAIRFAELVGAEGIDHVHAHWATYPATVAAVISRLSGVPWSLTCHAHDIFQDPTLLKEKIESASFALTCTADNKRYLETLTPAARGKVRVSYHGLDLRRFRPPLRRRDGAPPHILAVGSLLPCKGFDLLVEACALLAARGIAFRATIAGGGPEEQGLRAAIRARRLEGMVELTGYLGQEALVPLYQDADLFVLPAVLEMHWGIPNVLVEAMASGLPVITTPLPSLPELVDDGVHGLVARNRDAADLAEKMAALLTDGPRRTAMGRAGRHRVEERFDVDRTIETVMTPLMGEAHAG
jgi:colanic acid/amylovoran biosynthesis glycosyltransferase